ncbi:MAG: rRNA maturation RNase YbeY [Candidatus Moraniibacteriota bacterium]
MKISLEISGLKGGCHFDKKKLELAVRRTIEEVDQKNFSKKNFSISLVFVSEEKIRDINRQYRQKDSSTDVLSFAEFESEKAIQKNEQSDIFLGEIFICPKDIKKYCQKENIFFELEFFEVLSHGVLHLLGLEHGLKMFKLQKKIADEIALF